MGESTNVHIRAQGLRAAAVFLMAVATFLPVFLRTGVVGRWAPRQRHLTASVVQPRGRFYALRAPV